MRALASIAFSFSAAILLLNLLGFGSWALWAAAGSLIPTAVFSFCMKHGKKRTLLLLFTISFAVGLLYGYVWNKRVVCPVQAQCGNTAVFTATVCDWPEEREDSYRITVRLAGTSAKAVCYCADAATADLEPGQVLSGSAYWQDASVIRDTQLSVFTARHVFVLLYCREMPAVSAGEAGALRYLPQRAAKAMQEKITAIWEDSTVAGLLRAELLGDRSGISDALSGQFSEAGVSHLFAVSGLHCSFLITLLSLLIGSGHRRILAGCGIGVLLFYMVLVGLTPSVIRACVMQIFLLLAPLLLRDTDAPTALGAALLILLLCNPYAIAGVSLQLSFGAMLGMILLTPRLFRFLKGIVTPEQKWAKWLVSSVAGMLATSVGAMVFTVPLTVYYFGVLSVFAPISSLLAIPLASLNFMAGLVTVLLGFLWLPAAKLAGLVSFALSKLFLLIVRGIVAIPYHALYTDATSLVYWLFFTYALFLLCICTKDRRRKYAFAAALSVLSLVVSISLTAAPFRSGDLTAIALDVGQGESVLLTSGGETMLIDCGSSNSYENAARTVLAKLNAMQENRLDAVAITHYHADHTNGLYELLERVSVGTLYLPQIEDEYGVKDRLLTLANEEGIAVIFVEQETMLSLGKATVTVYPPVGTGDLNEQGLSFLCSSSDFDFLITGDMSGKTEEALLETYSVPDVEVLMVSHHGSKYSSGTEFLEEIQPEAAIISVGSNSYGHPTDAALSRLQAAGAVLYRTDRQGSITVTVHGD